MISLHTIENIYDADHNYHQFIQRGRQHLLDSEAIGGPGTLRSFLQGDVIEALDELDDRTANLLERTLESGDVAKLLSYAERVCMRNSGAEHVCMTCFGEWTLDTVVIEPPSLRELQEDVWAEDPVFSKWDWKHEVANDDTTLGLWEWVSHMREGQPITLVAQNGYLYFDWDDIVDQDHQKQLDGADCCLMFRYPAGDVDMVRWPEPNLRLLRGALFDARESGIIKDTLSVLMPDGGEFLLDEPYWNVGDNVTWTDPDDGVCSRTGVLTAVSELGDFNLAITMEDGWMAEVCESELKRVP